MVDTKRNNVEVKLRNEYIDFVKGILIVLVVWGHVISNCKAGDFYENPLFKFICSFHMPLFMGVSGYLFYYSINKYRGVNLVIRRCGSMLYPAVIWGAMLFVVRLFVGYRPESLFMAFKDLYGCIKELWFLWSVVFNACGVIAVNKLLKGRIAKLLGYIILFFAFCLIPKINNPVFIYMFPCYVIGFEIHNYREKMNKKIIYAINGVSFIGFIFMLMYFDTSHYIYTSGINPFKSLQGFVRQVGIDIFRWIVAALGSIVMLEVLKNIYEGFLGGKVINFLKYIGIISLEIYVVQKILVETLLPAIMINHKFGWTVLLPLESEVIYNFVITPVLTILFILLIVIFVKWTSRSKIISMALFGRVP